MVIQTKTLAKINSPKLNKIYPRQRLLQLLQKQQDKPLLWICANAGAGKTTLVASYLEKHENVTWYNMDAGDMDPASFFYYLQLAQGGKATLPYFKPEYREGIETFSRDFFRRFFANCQKPAVLVIDNYQECPDESPLHTALAHAFAEADAQVQIIVISREEPPSAYARMRSQDSMYILTADELALTTQETLEVCAQKLQTKADKLDPKTIERLHKLTQGWITGCILLLDRIRRNDLPNKFDPHEFRIIHDYFKSEIFDPADPVLQDFMVKAALLPVIIPDIVNQITASSNAARVLSNLARGHYFLAQHTSVKSAYVFHPLFREFLLEQAAERLGRYELIDMIETSASMLNEAGHIESAIFLYEQIQDWHAIAKIISSKGLELVQTGRHQTIQDWIEAIPENVLQTTPWLQYWKGVATQPYNLQLARKYYTQAFDLFKRYEESEGFFSAWLGVVETFIMEWGNFKPLDPWIEEMHELLKTAQKFPNDAMSLRISAGMFSALMYRQPDNKSLPAWEAKLFHGLKSLKRGTLQLTLGYQLFFYYIVWMGDLPKAQLVADLIRPANNQPLDAATHTLWFALNSIFLWKSGEHEKALEQVKQGLELAASAEYHLWDSLLYASGVYSSLSLQQHEQANLYLQKMSDSLDPNRLYDVTHYHYICARLYLFQGRVHESIEHCESGLKAAQMSGSPYAEALIRTIQAQALYQYKQREKAVAVNNMVRESATRMRTKNMLYFALMSEAEFAFDNNADTRGKKALQEAMTIAQEQNLIKHAFWWPPIMAKLCMKALEFDIATEFVQRVIQERHIVPESPPTHLENWPWQIKIYTLGRLSIAIDGKAVKFSKQAGKKPLELLSALITLGGRDISQHNIMQIVWPDAEGDAATQVFHTTLHRLRKVIGEDTLILNNTELTINPRLAWVDVWTFERASNELSRVLKLVPNEANLQKINSLSEQVLDLYQGHFLANQDENAWVIPVQDKLKQRMLTLLMEIGAYWQRRNQWDQSIYYYRRGLELDSLAEEMYQLLMQALEKTDRASEAVAAFKQFEKQLHDAAGSAPSEKTLTLYRRISQTGVH